MARMRTDRPVPSGIPRGFRGQDQLDGTPTTHFTPPVRGAPLQDRPPKPDRPSDSGIERAMADLADKEHPR